MMKRFVWLIVFMTVGIAAQQRETLPIVVEQGEQLGLIAQRYLRRPAFVHWPEIAKINHLKAPYTIHPGMVMNLPVHLLATKTAIAKWVAVTGEVRVLQKDGAPIIPATGGALGEGERVAVGINSSALIELADGSLVKLLGGSELVLDESRYFKSLQPYSVKAGAAENLSGTKAFTGLLRLIQGVVETRATPATDRARPLRIQTPTAVVGVRGTEFRVSYLDAVTRAEVTQGLVAAQLDEGRSANVAAGFGVKLEPNQSQSPEVVALLNAPDLTSWPLMQETLTVEFSALPSLQDGKKVSAYRIQLAADAGMTQISFNKLFPSGSIFRIADLANGTWYVNVRAVDEQGLEGKNASATLVLKAHPQPPFIQTPKPNEKIVQGQDVQLSWAKPSRAHGFLIELKNEKKDTTSHAVQDSKLDVKNLAAGAYSWRIATQIKTAQTNLDTGPWSDWQKFTIIAAPEPVQGGLDKEGKALNLRWSDRQAKEYEVQLAIEPSFDATKSPLVVKTTAQPEVSIPDIKAGQYYIRYRAIETDGFVGGWSGTMEVTVPFNWIPVWLFLGWAAIAL